MTSSMRKQSDDSLCCRPDTVRLNFRNPAEVICIKCYSRFPCQHFGIKPNLKKVRSFAEVIILPVPSAFEPGCTLELYNPVTEEWIHGTKCNGEIIWTHQGWTSNSSCDSCGQVYLNLSNRLVYEILELHTF